MAQKPTQKTFHLNAIVAGWVVYGEVSFSPAPEPGVLTELARFEAERLINQLATEEIASTQV